MSKFTSAMIAAKDRSIQVADAVEQQPTMPTVGEIRFAPPPSARRGRPAGKRSSNESVQVTAYIKSETHYATKLALLVNSRKGAPKMDFSDLVEQLLAGWLKVQP